MLKLDKIDTYYGTSHVIQGLSLEVQKGQAVSILGRNGVGKTTTMRSIMGLTSPRSGQILIEGQDTTHWPPHLIARLGVAYVPAERQIFPELSVEENLKVASRPGPGKNLWTLERVYHYFPILGERRKQEGVKMSGGEQQMLAIGRALMGNPRLMLLDEPSQGLAPILVQMVAEIVATLCRENGLTLLLVEQNYRIAMAMATHHYLMGTKSKIEGFVTTKEIVADEEIIKKHLSV